MARPAVWLFDLDDTLHDASSASMPHLHVSFGEYIQAHLGLTKEQSDALRRRYWQRYGATLLGLVRHHGVKAAHFLDQTHRLPGLEQRVRGHRPDLAAIARLPGRRYVLTNAPAAYAQRVLGVLGIGALFGCGRSPMRACCAGWSRACACRRPAACWSRTRWCTSARPAASA